MIDQALVFLRDRLKAHLGATSGTAPDASAEELVVFLDADKVDPLVFKTEAVTILLVNVDQERVLRPADLYSRPTPDGRIQRVSPEIRLYLDVLFVARFKKYEAGLGYLSEVIRYFQEYPVFDHRNAPELSDELERLVVELVTVPLAQLNDLWGALRTTYQPSVLYRVGLIVYRHDVPAPVAPVQEIEIRTHA